MAAPLSLDYSIICLMLLSFMTLSRLADTVQTKSH